MDLLTVAFIVFAANFVQSATGFGLALTSMPLLIAGLGIQVAAPLIALVSLVTQSIILLRYRAALNLRTVAKLAAASFIGIPVGLLLLEQASERLVFTLLGVVVAGYALYALLNLRLPPIQNPRWAYVFGFMSGLLSGGYNVGGPPVIVYGSCLRWEPAEFKSNLQGIFQFNSAVVIVGHALAGNFTTPVWESFLVSLPAIALGTLLGLSLDRHINPALFRKIVLVFLVIVGLNLILTA